MPDITIDPALSIEAADVSKDILRDNFQGLINRGLNALPEDLPGNIGGVPSVNAGGTGLDYASPKDFKGQSVAGYRSGRVPTEFTAATLTIDDGNAADYTGRTLVCNRATSQTLTIAVEAGDGFWIKIHRKGAGGVAIAGSGLTLRHRQGFSAAAGQWAVLCAEIIGTDLWLYGDMA